MTGTKLLAILKDRDLTPVWTDGGLRVRGKPEELTPALKGVMQLHREWLEQQFRPKPPPPRPLVILWKMRTPGIVLESLLGSTAVDKTAKKHRCYFRPWIPCGAVAWTELKRGGHVREDEWKPLSELPAEWGLGTAVDVPLPDDDEEES